MSGFSTINLMDIEDSVGDRAPGLEARFARKHLESRDLGVSLFRYAPNLRSPMAHSHREQEEAYVVVAGSGRVLLGDEMVELRQWDVVRVAPEIVRAFEAGPDGLDVIAVGGPKPADGDGVRATVTWPDTAQPTTVRVVEFSRELRNDVLAGDITLTVRLWKRPQVKEGGRYRVGPGEIEVDAVDLLPFAAITAADVRQAGEPGREALRRRAAHAGPIDDDTLVYRIAFHAVSPGD